MKITWIGHACFKIEKDGYVIIIDPYEDNYVPGLGPIREEADLVLCTHGHGDHNAVHRVSLRSGRQNPFTVTEIHTYHDDAKGSKRGPNTIYLFECEGMRIAHFGDIGCELEPDQIELLKGLDAAMIPVGGFFTIDGDQAAELVARISPKIVIPMHYADKKLGTGFDVISDVDLFTRHFDNVKILSESTIDPKAAHGAQVVVLKPARAVSRT